MRTLSRPPLSRAVAGLATLGLMACSLSLEDPEMEARRKLAKPVEPTWELLEGRWLGDSTYTLFDDRATTLGQSLILDIFPDSTVWAWDATGLVFPGTHSVANPVANSGTNPGTYSAQAAYSGGVLRLSPGPGTAGADSLAVRMTFLGNWLELERTAELRFSHFHKVKPFDSLSREALLDSGIWLRRAVRIARDTVRPDSLRRDFDYLTFPGDSMRHESRRGGLTSLAAGPLAPQGRRFAWTPSAGTRSVHLDLYHADSLRLWPMTGGRADSGYSLYVRGKGLHRLDLDLTGYAGHLRTDTVKTDVSTLDTHFGRYYDLELGIDHDVRTFTNMPGMPRYASWSVDSGYLWLDGDGGIRTRFTASKPTDSTLVLRSDTTRAFPRPTILMQTLVDGSRFADHPLERFGQAPYLHLVVTRAAASAADTLAYYFHPSYRKLGLEDFELVRYDADDTSWAVWRLDGSAETFASGQDKFHFAFQGRTASLGRFTCRSDPSLDLTLRSLPVSDPGLAQGLVQGRCRLVAADTPSADSTLEIAGEFRGRRRTDILFSPLWNLP